MKNLNKITIFIKLFAKIRKKFIDKIETAHIIRIATREIEQIADKEVNSMYPNFKAEYARGDFTLEKLVEEMKNRGLSRTVQTLSLKLKGDYPLTLGEAKMLRDIVAPEIPIDTLFEEAS